MDGRSSVRCINSTGLLLTATHGSRTTQTGCYVLYIVQCTYFLNGNTRIIIFKLHAVASNADGSLTFHSLKMDINAVRSYDMGGDFLSALFYEINAHDIMEYLSRRIFVQYWLSLNLMILP